MRRPGRLWRVKTLIEARDRAFSLASVFPFDVAVAVKEMSADVIVEPEGIVRDHDIRFRRQSLNAASYSRVPTTGSSEPAGGY